MQQTKGILTCILIRTLSSCANARNRTQDEVAEQLKMKRSTLSGYENRVAQPGVEVLLLFSEFYQIAVDTLLKVDLSKLSETQLRQLEHGEDVFLRGGNLRVLASTVIMTTRRILNWYL